MRAIIRYHNSERSELSMVVQQRRSKWMTWQCTARALADLLNCSTPSSVGICELPQVPCTRGDNEWTEMHEHEHLARFFLSSFQIQYDSLGFRYLQSILECCVHCLVLDIIEILIFRCHQAKHPEGTSACDRTTTCVIAKERVYLFAY